MWNWVKETCDVTVRERKGKEEGKQMRKSTGGGEKMIQEVKLTEEMSGRVVQE